MTTSEKPRDFFVGVQVSPLRISATVVDGSLRLHGKTKRSTKAERGADEVLNRVIRSIRDVVDEADLSLGEVSGVGIALCGQFSPEMAGPDRPLATAWKEVCPSLRIASELQLPVYMTTVGAASALGVQSNEAVKGAKQIAVLWIEAELAAGLIENGQLSPSIEQQILGDDRWLNWGPALTLIPGKRRYRKMRTMLSRQEPEAEILFGGLIEHIRHVLTRLMDQLQPDRVALVGGGAEELKDELTAALARRDPELWERLARAHCSVPALSTNACQLGAALFAAHQLKQKDS